MTVSEFHNKALNLAEQAFLSKRENAKKAIGLFKQAFQMEKKAIELARLSNAGELTITVLLKSAASLALNASLLRDAEKLIASALAGDPPDEIANELRSMMDEVNFDRHLKLNGITLDNTDLQFVIAGNGVSDGMAKGDLFLNRIDAFEKLAIRTIERKMNKPFREKGNIPDNVRELYQSYYSVPRRASFALTIRIGKVKQQLEVPGLEKSRDIIDDLMQNIKLLSEGNELKLREVIKDDAYFRNFVSLAKELAPDGDDVSVVGFTVARNGKEKIVKLTRKKEDFDLSQMMLETKKTKSVDDKLIQVNGILSAADIDSHKVRLKTDKKKKVNVNVPKGMGDIVRKYFELNVTIKGFYIDSKTIELSSIDLAKS